ncbi:profilin-1 [Stegastes partitus]|uniref:Profilin n=1 Tax=Stegastes partitus TaxID=144197 RepID=A0A3B4Z103_9TELE|nr:PREDICTED: profilin-2-like [Stegastes partitus]
MSWQDYIDNLKTPDQSGMAPIMEAAICGASPGQEAIWAKSSGLASISADEIKKLNGDRSSFFQNGVYISGVKCRMLRDMMSDTPPCMDMKTAPDADGATYNICVGKTKTALVIGKGTKEASGGQVNAKVCGVVKYLTDLNM